MDDMDDVAFCERLPKTELHAHLTGSIMPGTLHEIWQEKKRDDPNYDLGDPVEVLGTRREDMNADTFFPLFSEFIYRLCDSKKHIQQCTASVLSDFRKDGVQYLELRTIPRSASDVSKEEYIQTVLEVFQSHSDAPERTYLILSIDRKNTPEEAADTVRLAIKYKSQGVVGVDLAGNPAKGDVQGYAQAFRAAKDAGLKITLHFAEVKYSSQDEELRALLGYEPDRLGHVIQVPNWAKDEIEKRRIGVELCLTCNVAAKLIEGEYAAHHFGWWWGRKKCPIAICTDDVGVFASRTSNEYVMLMKHFGLTREDVLDVCQSSVDCIFGTEKDKKNLREQLETFRGFI